MKKYFKILVLLCFLGLFSSCEDFLDPDPVSAIPTSEFYNSPEELEQGIIAVYDAIQGVNTTSLNENRGIQLEFFVTEMLSDNTNTRSPDANDTSDAGQFENFSVRDTNSLSANYYASMFEVIFLSNKIIDSLTLGIVSDDDQKNRLEAEAKFLRAYAYFNLIRLYGELTDTVDRGLPYVDHVLTDAETTTQYTRVSVGQIYELIISDLIIATEGLDDTYTTRASKSAAHTLLAKAYLSLETPLYGNAISHLDEVYGNYELMSAYEDIYGTSNELNDEIIFAIGFQKDLINDSQNYSAEFVTKGNNTSGLNYLTSLFYDDLVEFGGINRNLAYDDSSSGEDAKWATMKHLADLSSTSTTAFSGVDFIVLRYADVIMLYAEAYMQGGDSVTLLEPWGTDYNLIRTRAGLDTVLSVTKDELLDERRYEFYTENQRLFDLKRFGVVNQVLGDFAASVGYNFDVRESVLPIPLREINLSPTDDNGKPLLIQNSFWE